jgi:hypothetical protein
MIKDVIMREIPNWGRESATIPNKRVIENKYKCTRRTFRSVAFIIGHSCSAVSHLTCETTETSLIGLQTS